MPVILSVYCCAAAAVNFVPTAGSAAAVVRSCRRFMSAPPKAHSIGNRGPTVDGHLMPSFERIGGVSLELERKRAGSHGDSGPSGGGWSVAYTSAVRSGATLRI